MLTLLGKKTASLCLDLDYRLRPKDRKTMGESRKSWWYLPKSTGATMINRHCPSANDAFGSRQKTHSGADKRRIRKPTKDAFGSRQKEHCRELGRVLRPARKRCHHLCLEWLAAQYLCGFSFPILLFVVLAMVANSFYYPLLVRFTLF